MNADGERPESLSVRIANKCQKKRHPVEHDIVSEDAFVSDSDERGHMVTCSCGEAIKVSVDLQHPATPLRGILPTTSGVCTRGTPAQSEPCQG